MIQPTTPTTAREVRVGSLDHLTTSPLPYDQTSRTLCGTWIAGTPVGASSTGLCGHCKALRGLDSPAGAGSAVEADRG